jgi:hypothetical protein
MEVISMADSSPLMTPEPVHPGREAEALPPFHDVIPENLGIVGMLEFQKTLERLTETYVPPAECDYRTY